MPPVRPPIAQLLCTAATLLAVPAWAQAAPPRWVNSLGMPFVRIAPGSFRMGSDEAVDALARAYPGLERRRLAQLDDEAPVHTVRITRAFYLGQTEVTVGQFRRFVQASGYRTEAEADGTGGYGYNADYDPDKSARGDAFEGRDVRYSWRNPGFAQGEDHPVVNITWHDAHALAAWLSAAEGRRYRLPTEAEWEYAARGGPFWQNEPYRYAGSDLLAQVGWYNENSGGETRDVGLLLPNALGLYDMSGNVWEWCADNWHDNYQGAPDDGNAWPGGDKERAVLRGGSWPDNVLNCRVARRFRDFRIIRFNDYGFRLARGG